MRPNKGVARLSDRFFPPIPLDTSDIGDICEPSRRTTPLDVAERRVAWVHHDQIKNGKALPIPLNAAAILVLRRQVGKHRERVFTFRGQPVSQVNTKAWKQALKHAGIENFRWHDLRHTWASWHVQSGTPLQVLQELGGWSCYEMVLRYAHLSAGHLADYAENLCRPRAVDRTRSDTLIPMQ